MFSLRPRGWMWALLAVLAVAIASGSMIPNFSSTTGIGATDGSARASETAPGQLLPIEQRAWLGDRWVYFEVARSPAQQATGLMFREALSRDQGMFFPFDPPRPVRFWMRNVTISLDMVFVRNERVVAISPDVPPCTTPTCPTYGPENTAVDGVIELAGGTAARFGIAVGDRAEFESIDPTPPAWFSAADSSEPSDPAE